MRSYGDPCGVARGLDVIGERWALLVVRDLLLGPKRFNDLHAGLPGVSPNVLAQRLRELAEHGVVQRRDLPPPARVRLYELTDRGRALEPLLLHLGRWGSQAPTTPDGSLGIDSILLSIKAAFDPARTAEQGSVYELHIDSDTYCIEITDDSLNISRETAHQPPRPPSPPTSTPSAPSANTRSRWPRHWTRAHCTSTASNTPNNASQAFSWPRSPRPPTRPTRPALESPGLHHRERGSVGGGGRVRGSGTGGRQQVKALGPVEAERPGDVGEVRVHATTRCNGR